MLVTFGPNVSNLPAPRSECLLEAVGGLGCRMVINLNKAPCFRSYWQLFSPFQIGYLMFNEQKRLQLALKVVYLQLPIIEYPNYLKGIYLTHDYNRNPIARRVLLSFQHLTRHIV